MALQGPLPDYSCILIPIVVTLHLLIAPYTKVEESFNVQATHDVLVFGLPTSNVYERLRSTYDHFTFPGAVPRTFVGPVLLAGVSQPIIALTGFGHAQRVVRLVLGVFNAISMMFMSYNLQRSFGSHASRWYAVLQASQFHVMFYASRPLPNMFAFGLTTLAYAQLIAPSRPYSSGRKSDPYGMLNRQRLAVSLLVFAAVIFRSEVALLLSTIMVFLVTYPLSHVDVLKRPFLISFLVALLISVPLDSYFWQTPLWPELWGFYYNAVLGSSSAWGVSPWHWYFTSALPRLLLDPLLYLLLIPTAWRKVSHSPTPKLLIIPSLLFVAIYSLQPHKEARFIFYVVPPLTAAAAIGADWIFTRRNKSILYRLTSYVVVLSVLASFAASIAMSLVSSLNYPGGEALYHVRWRIEHPGPNKQAGLEPDPRDVRVHADVLSCMTGVTLFGTSANGKPAAPAAELIGNHDRSEHRIVLDKTEDPVTLADPNFWLQFDYVLAEDPTKVTGGEWDDVAVVDGYAGIEILRPGMEGGGREGDLEKGKRKRLAIHRGAFVASLKNVVRSLTGGWWVGPRMEPRIHILRRVKGGRGRGEGVLA